MKSTVQIAVESALGQPDVIQQVAHLEGGADLQPAALGLSPTEARSILAGLEETMVQAQAAGVCDSSRMVALVAADSADAEAVIAAVERTASALGGLDTLVNNAGVLAVGPLEDFKLADFDRTLAINVRAVFVATQAAVRHMKTGGRVINIGSTNAERMPFPGGGVYAMSKSALQGLVHGLARDLGAAASRSTTCNPGRSIR